MWQLEDKTLGSRLLLGTAGYPSPEILQQAITAANCSVITVALKRSQQLNADSNAFWQLIKNSGCELLPNTAGCRTSEEAITTAEMGREIFATNWVKLEIIGDDYTLQPNPFELVKAAKQLTTRGFRVLPYCTEDLILCQRLLDAGCQTLMPWAAPIGSAMGPLNLEALQLLRTRLTDINLIIDAGIGCPSHACQVMEMGFDGVLLNSACAKAADPVLMAKAFANSISAGYDAYHAGILAPVSKARASTPLVDTPFWEQV